MHLELARIGGSMDNFNIMCSVRQVRPDEEDVDTGASPADRRSLCQGGSGQGQSRRAPEHPRAGCKSGELMGLPNYD